MNDDCDNVDTALHCPNDNADDNVKDDWSHTNIAACFWG